MQEEEVDEVEVGEVGEDSLRFLNEPAYEQHPRNEGPLNNTIVSQEDLHEVATSTHEVISGEDNGEPFIVDHGDIVVEVSHENIMAEATDLADISHEGLISEDESLSSIHGSQDCIAHEVNSQDSLVDDDASISSLHAMATSTAGNLSDDMSEFLMSPSVSSDDKVSFKTEVASSPAQEASPGNGH